VINESSEAATGGADHGPLIGASDPHEEPQSRHRQPI
jgi:hypothetical protein